MNPTQTGLAAPPRSREKDGGELPHPDVEVQEAIEELLCIEEHPHWYDRMKLEELDERVPADRVTAAFIKERDRLKGALNAADGGEQDTASRGKNDRSDGGSQNP